MVRPFSRPICNTALVRRTVLAATLSLILPMSALAQHTGASHGLKWVDHNAGTSVPAPSASGKKGAAPTATINITFTGSWPQNASLAFQYAADIWETHVESAVPISVTASWEALDENVLGAAGPTNLSANRSQFAYQNVFYPIALAEAIVGRELNGVSNPDIQATFSSAFTNWYFGTDARPPSGQIDFVSVVLHELGHGLGFTGSFGVEDANPDDQFEECDFDVSPGLGCWGITASTGSRLPVVFDLFAEDQNEVQLLNTTVYPNPSAALANVLQSDRVFFDGSLSGRIVADVPISLYAPASFEPGSSFSHLDEAIFEAGDINSLMTPKLASSEAVHTPGPLTCAIFEDLGWPLGPDCLQFLATPAELPEIAVLNMVSASPNPFTTRTQLQLHVDVPQQVRAEVYNTAGQRVADLPERLMIPGISYTVELDGSDWPAGVYLVRLTGESFAHTEKIIRVR